MKITKIPAEKNLFCLSKFNDNSLLLFRPFFVILARTRLRPRFFRASAPVL
nr:MAG TPA: hypothetical protein [Caudoviricetes sp.]DAG32353.1 MAG TPA: hypothetical protein [Caudoviricetes sp.]